jgi:aminopeptidase 2
VLRYLVEYTFAGLSAEKDYQDIVEFFKDKDTSKYSQALAQTLESIRAKTAWIDVSLTVARSRCVVADD